MSYDYYEASDENITGGSGGMWPCPGSNGATFEQLMIVNDLGTVFGLVLQNVFAISGILGMQRTGPNDLSLRQGLETSIDLLCPMLNATQFL